MGGAPVRKTPDIHRSGGPTPHTTRAGSGPDRTPRAAGLPDATADLRVDPVLAAPVIGPVNAPVRNAVVRRFQQDHGNRATQSVVTKVAPRPKAPLTTGKEEGDEKERDEKAPAQPANVLTAVSAKAADKKESDQRPAAGPGRARGAIGRTPPPARSHPPRSEELETEEESAEALALEEASDVPFAIELPEPLPFTDLTVAYGAPADLMTSTLRFPPLPVEAAEAAAERNRAALMAITDAYATTARDARQKHDSLVDECNASVSALRNEYSLAVMRTTSAYTQASSEVDAAYEINRSRVDEAFASAEAAIDAGASSARRTAVRTAASGRARLMTRYRSADGEIDKIVTEIADPFGKSIEAVKTSIQARGTAVDTALTKFKSDYPKLYPLSGSAVVIAENEAVQTFAEKAVPHTAESIRDAVADALEQYTQTGKDTVDGVKRDSRPPLDSHKEAIKTEGIAAVNRTMGEALKQIDRQTAEAHKGMREMHTHALRELGALRRGSRARLSTSARNLLQGLRTEAEAAIRGLHQGTRSSLVLYERTITRLAENAKRGAEQGPDQLNTVAKSATADIPRSLTAARRQQGDQITGNQRRAVDSLVRREAASAEEIRQEVAETTQGIVESADRNIGHMRDALGEHTAAFALADDAIAGTSESWAKPFTVAFPKYGAEAVKANIKPHKEWETKLNTNKDKFLKGLEPLLTPGQYFYSTFFGKQEEVFNKVSRAASVLKRELFATFNTTESRVTGALHKLTKLQGDAIVELFGTHVMYPFPEPMGLYGVLRAVLWDNDYNACVAYLAGNHVEGARHELKESTHWYNDEEARIETVMRDLTPEERTHLTDTDLGREAVAEVRDSLGGTDLNVFDALKAGNDLRASAYRLKDKMQESREANDLDAFNAELAKHFPSPSAGEDRATANERREAMVRELAAVLDNVPADQPATMAQPDALQKVLNYALQPVEGLAYNEQGEMEVRMLKIEGAQKDYAEALITHGAGSVPARIARLGVEFQRTGKPNFLNLDETLIDPRLNPNYADQYSAQEKTDAARERYETLEGFARKYLPEDKTQGPGIGQTRTDQAFRERFGTDFLGADLTSRWIREPVPSPETAAIAMRIGQRGDGTNEELMNRTAERMNRSEIRQMVASYRTQTKSDENPNGRDFYHDVGVFGSRGRWGSELSGDEALKFEVKLLGIPQSDQERAEVAALEAQQQMEETGAVGKWLAGGTVAEQDLLQGYANLQRVTGGSVTFGADGTPKWTGGLFDKAGNYTGDRPRELSRAIQLTRLAAEAYAEKIDSYANAATLGIAIIGAIVAAVVTVVTWGAATPLLIGAISLVTGLAAMGAHKAISGGRYGWEEMLVDLGLTFVQAITAGVGQHLSLVSRGGVAAARAAMQAANATKGIATLTAAQARQLSNRAFRDMVLIGAATGGLNSLGQTALSETTWSKGLDFALDELLAGLARGVISGAATAAVSNAFDNVKMPFLPRQTVQSVLGESTNPLLRGGVKAVTSGLGAFTGRSVELGFEKARRRYKGDAGDIFVASLESAAQNAAQSFGEGAAEARTQAAMLRREQRRMPQAEGEGTTPTRLPGEIETDPLRLPAAAPDSELQVPVPPRVPAPGDADVGPTVPRAGRGVAEPPARTAAATEGEVEPEGARRPGAAPEPGAPSPPRREGPEGPRPPRTPEDEFNDPFFRELTTGPLVRAPAEGLALRIPAAQERYWGVDSATGMTVQEYRFLASRGLPPRDAAGQPLLGPNANVMTRMRIHSPDPGAPAGSASRGGWTLSIEQGNLRMTGDGVWFDRRYGTAPDGTRIPVEGFQRGSRGDWVDRAGQPVGDARVRAALDQWDANMASSHIPLFPHERGATGPPSRGPATPPAPETPPMVPRAPAQEPQSRPGGTAADAALGITGSSFTGDAAARIGVRGARQADLEQAMTRLAAPDGMFAARNAAIVEAPDAPHAMRIDARNGEPLTIKIALVDTLPVTDGEVPVAKYSKVGDREYLVQISKGSRPEAVERALAHELAEMSARHRTTGEPPDALAVKPHEGGKERVSTLSPHDHGRLAELEVLGRRLAELPLDSPQYRATLDEAQRLAAHLGLVGEGEGVGHRQKLAREALGDGLGRAILDHATATALDNPFLQRLTGVFADDLNLLQRRIEHARSLGEPAGRVVPWKSAFEPGKTLWTHLERQVIETIRQLVLREGIVERPTETRAAALHRERVDALARELAPGFMKLVEAGVQEAARQLPPGVKGKPPEDPSVIDPHTAAATRALFGDQEHFQDWPAFLKRYGNENKHDPEVLRRIFEQWAAGSYVPTGGERARSLLSGVERPSPGYEHRFLIDPARNETIRLPGDHQITIFSKAGGERLASVDDAVAERAKKLADAAALRTRMNDPQTDTVTRAQLKKQIDGIMQNVRDISEALGIAAGVAFAKSKFGDAEIIVMRGSGVPDVVVKRPPNGPIIVIECKGGTSPFGVRSSIDGTVKVEQGTKEYLLSLATEMSRVPDDTAEGKKIKENGRLLLDQLTAQGAPDTEYYVVRQPIDPTGPTAPEVGKFDTSGKLKKPPE